MTIETGKPHWRLMPILLLAALVCGATEAFYGETSYAGDAISYLDIARALRRGDWKTALSPYWGLGYQLVLSVWTRIFPSGPVWEWVGIHCLNLLIFCAAFFAFYGLLAQGICLVQNREKLAGTQAERFLLLAALPIFLTCELCMDSAARVGPDMLVSCLVYTALGVLLRMGRRSGAGSGAGQALLLGALLGAGYIAKAIFLPLSLVVILVEIVVLWRHKVAFRMAALTVVAMAVFAIPYAAGLSWAFGHRTLGEAGSLNYAWLVNKLQMETFWQGGPAGFGTPVHRPTQAMQHPDVFLFDEPFAVTYAPWFDPPYFYYGYRHFFSLRSQIHTILLDLKMLWSYLASRLIVWVLIAGLLLRRLRWKQEAGWAARFWRLWPMLLVALAGLSIYVLVFVEMRYIASFTAVLMMALGVAIVGRDDDGLERRFPARVQAVFLALLLLAWVGTVPTMPRNEALTTVEHLTRHQSFSNYDQVRAAVYLEQIGMQPGDKVALVADHNDGLHCTAAYLAHLKVIGQVGGRLVEPAPDDMGVFWHTSTAVQRQTLEIFRHAGARLVLALHVPGAANLEGWENVPGTEIWIYRFAGA